MLDREANVVQLYSWTAFKPCTFWEECMEFTGEFETHITVRLHNSDEIKELQKWSKNHGLKCLHIVLDQGVTTSQPMLTRHGWGNFTNELRIGVDLCQALNAEGFSVVRIKIETAPWNQGVPQSNAEALNQSHNRYFEHHIKLLLKPSADLVPLLELAKRNSAHLSRNVLQTRSDNYYERFVTQRCMVVGRIEAQQQLQKLLDAIADEEYSVIKVEEEFVVHDSNLGIDQGWICSQT